MVFGASPGGEYRTSGDRVPEGALLVYRPGGRTARAKNSRARADSSGSISPAGRTRFPGFLAAMTACWSCTGWACLSGRQRFEREAVTIAIR